MYVAMKGSSDILGQMWVTIRREMDKTDGVELFIDIGSSYYNNIIIVISGW